MFETHLIATIALIAFVLPLDLCVIAEPPSDGVETIFKEIGFSPFCVSQSLALCEGSQRTFAFLEKQEHLKSSKKSLEEFKKSPKRPRNCYDLLKLGDKESGVRTVYPFSCCENRPVSVLCDQTTDGGGWTVIQHRENLPQRENFFRTWIEYQIGFGNLSGEFWLGLENIHAIVKENLLELRVDLEDFEGAKRWAKYEHFYIGDASEKYKLSLGAYSGDAGDSLTGHNGMKFSTKDQDNDSHGPGSCAVPYKGAWWYNNCHSSNLNGFPYEGYHSSYADGINWHSFRNHNNSLKVTSLSLKPKFEVFTIEI